MLAFLRRLLRVTKPRATPARVEFAVHTANGDTYGPYNTATAAQRHINRMGDTPAVITTVSRETP